MDKRIKTVNVPSSSNKSFTRNFITMTSQFSSGTPFNMGLNGGDKWNILFNY